MKFQIKNIKVNVSNFGIIIFLFFILVSVISLNVVKNKILTNSEFMGTAIAARFAGKETSNIKMQEVLLKSAANNVEQIIRLNKTNSKEEIKNFIQTYTQFMNSNGELGTLEMRAVIDGELICDNEVKYSSDRNYHFNWYNSALENNGKVAYSNIYRYGDENGGVFTVSMKLNNSNDVLAISMYPKRLEEVPAYYDLPKHSFYYLCDENGNLLYAITDLKKPVADLQPYVDHIIREIKNGDLDKDTSSIYDYAGNRRGVYYKKSDNGWISIVTIPYEFIMKDYQSLLYWYIIVLATFAIFGLVMYMRENILNSRVESINEAVKVLGNSYYAIYRINVNSGRYSRMKSTTYVGARTAVDGDYNDLLKVFLEVVDEETAADFAKTFSLENIRLLVESRVKDFGGDFRQRFDDGYRWSNVRLLFDDSLQSGEVILCFKEVDAEKRLQLEHMQLTDDALKTMKKSTESKNMFFSSMSHDMRTPLNGIIGLSELAGHYVNDPAKVKAYLEKINLSSKQLLSLINDVLEMAKLEHGKIKTNEELFDLRDNLENCLNVFELQAKQENKTFIKEFDLQNTSVCGDFQRINQILNNILSNAFKYTPENGKIIFKVKEVRNQETAKYQFVVQDTGYGMTKEFLKKIFEPFERDVRFGAKNIVGTGLGMAIVKNLVTQLEGDIHIESASGEGTCVTVTLPLMLEGTCSKCCAKGVQDGDSLQSGDAADLQSSVILVAEDNEINMEIVTELLQMQGFEVVQAWNGREAVEKFAAAPVGKIDMILMDMQMPEMNGCEAAKAIRDMLRSDAKAVPIIAVTANAFAEDIAATTAAGMNAHISKPIDFKLLEQTMREYIKKNQ